MGSLNPERRQLTLFRNRIPHVGLDGRKPIDQLLQDYCQFIHDAEKKKEIESRSKPLHELVVTENFTVKDVVAESYRTLFAQSELIGKPSPVYEAGFTSKLVLKVSPDNPIPVRTLNFAGVSIVRAGDYISAKIPKYEEKRVASSHVGPYYRDKVVYCDRDFNPEESAIELSILSKDGRVLRRDRAVNYKRFAEE